MNYSLFIDLFITIFAFHRSFFLEPIEHDVQWVSGGLGAEGTRLPVPR
jgi:hypothetical protein